MFFTSTILQVVSAMNQGNPGSNLGMNIIGSILGGIFLLVIMWVYRNQFIAFVERIKLLKQGICCFPRYKSVENKLLNAVSKSKSVSVLAFMGKEYLKGYTDTGNIEDSPFLKLIRDRPRIRVRFIVIDPSSSYTRIRASELEGEDDNFKDQMLRYIRSLCKLKEKFESFQVRIYNSNPVWRLTITDTGTFVGFYQSDTKSYDSVFFYIPAKSKQISDSFAKYFDELWDKSEDLSISVFKRIQKEVNNEN